MVFLLLLANQKNDVQKAFEADIAKNKKVADATKNTDGATEVMHATNEIADKYHLTDTQLLKAQANEHHDDW
ncbi:hypothetical protein V4S32_00090 [Enterococcus cecorum]